MKKIVIVLLFAFFVASCQKYEITLATADEQNLLVYSQKAILTPIITDDGFVLITESEKLKYLTKISSSGQILWQNKLAELFNFSAKVNISNFVLDKTTDNQILLAIVHTDSVKYRNTVQHIQFVKFDQSGNVLFNWQKPLIDGIDGSENEANLFSYFSAYQDNQGNIICLSKNSKWDDNTFINILTLQISKYSQSGELLSNVKLVIPEAYEFWKVLRYENNQFSIIFDSPMFSVSGYKPYIFTIDYTGNVIDTMSVYISGNLTYSLVANDHYFFITNSYYNGTNQIQEYDFEGNSINTYDINTGNKQFICLATSLINSDIYFVGVVTNNIFELNKLSMSWSKLSDNTYTELGEVRSNEGTTGIGVFVNHSGSLTLLGKKNSFGVENIFVLKTKTDGTVLME